MIRWIVAGFLAVFGLGLSGSITHTHDAYIYQMTPPIYRWFEEVETPPLDLLSLFEPYQVTPPEDVSPRLPVVAKELQIPVGVRLLVFSPHPDDETLAAGGLIQGVLAREGSVNVVFVTNGDGYTEGVRKELRRTQTSASDFIEYGKRRHGEALSAMAQLGLEAEDVIFLGFPDDGIDDLWASYWSTKRPYTSPYTRFDHPHYRESYNRWVKYAGIDLKDEMARIMMEFMPDWVVVPDPRDFHPDHCTTTVFVLEALRKLREEDQAHFLRTQVFTYLVHFMDYPASTEWVKEIKRVGFGGSSTASALLSSISWYSMPLTPEQVMGKQNALSAHQSQLLVMAGFLKQFLRPYELFVRLEASQVMALPRECAAQFRRSSN